MSWSSVAVMACIWEQVLPPAWAPNCFFDLIKRKRVHQFQLRGREMTVHKLKVSIAAEQETGRWPIINMEDNSVCNVTRLETLSSVHR